MSTNPTDNSNKQPIMIDPRMLGNYYDQDDEINLVDLWLSLVKQKNVFFATASIIILFSVLYILLAPENYTYKTDIAIGTQSQSQSQSQSQLIQSPEAVAANLNNAIIPKILKQQHINKPDSQLDVSVSIPKKTNSVLLTSKGTLEQNSAIAELHQQLINILADSHSNKVQHKLAYLKEELISSQSMITNLNKKLSNPTTGNEQLTLQIINLENNIRQTKRDIAEFTPTHSAMGTVQSIKPSNKSGKLILAVSIVLALFMGLGAALFAGFIVKVKEQDKIK